MDADACPRPVLQETVRAGAKYRVRVVTVASFEHNILSDKHITVGNGPQEADLKIINITEPGDLIITQDWGLAAMVLSKEAFAVSPVGAEYSTEKMTFMLEEREMKAKFRRSGGRTRGPKKRAAVDDTRFKTTLERILSRELRKESPDCLTDGE